MNAITPLIDPKCTALGLTVSPPIETDGLHWELSHLWLTENGGWDDVPAWAKVFQNDNLGGDHHVYIRGHRVDGYCPLEADLFVLGWPDGHHIFSPKEEHERWGNAVINAGFDWQKTPGPYYAQMNALNTSVVRGIGLPYPPYPWQEGVTDYSVHPWDDKTFYGQMAEAGLSTAPHAATIQGGLHTSFFLVFQEVEAYEPEPPVPPTPDQFQRVLDKAEECADWLTHNQNEKAAGAKVYLGIAELLSWL